MSLKFKIFCKAAALVLQPLLSKPFTYHFVRKVGLLNCLCLIFGVGGVRRGDGDSDICFDSKIYIVISEDGVQDQQNLNRANKVSNFFISSVFGKMSLVSLSV